LRPIRERSHIFGIEGQESQTFTRTVASGAKQRIGFFAALNPDCTASGDVNVRVIKQPEHGTVETVATTGYTHFPKENIRSGAKPLRHDALEAELAGVAENDVATLGDVFIQLHGPGGFADQLGKCPLALFDRCAAQVFAT
jgi:hypothetical protein